MTNSTPLPWAPHPNRRLARIVRDGGRGEGVAQFVYAADAELACRAVNALGPLVAALEAEERMSQGFASDEALKHARSIADRMRRDALRLAGKP